MWFRRRSARADGEPTPSPSTDTSEPMSIVDPATAAAAPGPSAQAPLPAEPPAIANAADVAKYLVVSYGPMEQLKLQKLLYYCQAGSLAWTDRPLFPDTIEAWANGPVVVSLWKHHRYEGFIEKVPEGEDLKDENARRIADSIFEHFGNLKPEQLSDLTREEPWRDARKQRPSDVRGRVPISVSAMRSYYSEKWNRGAAAS
ncbi:MAG TPA: type II toxin-antitoxin system antitoxin SocA domain-containing protein [Candidatus Elarobacter sp.]|nr:type II toxin-antitoxin system antitoxin SocA domain-containing protein [Candidatus Elarobacter sp.]